MVKSFLEYSLLEKIEFKERFVKALGNRIVRSDSIAMFLLKYIKDNEDDFLDWVEMADMFSTNRMVITSKNNRPNIMKMSRFLRKILPSYFTADQIDKFVLDVLTESIENTYFEMWHGEKIREAFSPENFLIKSGDLINSCMSNDECLPYFEIYCQNKNVNMLVMLHEKKILARAIVWNALYSDGKRVQNLKYHVMDNVYAINDIEKKKMIEYAKEHDWLYYFDIGSHFKDKIGKGYYGEFVVKLEKVDFLHYPYVDNMMYLDKNLKEISNRKGVFMMHNKDGSLPSCTTCQDEHQIMCSDCGGTGTINGENCKTCNGTSFIDCPDCSK